MSFEVDAEGIVHVTAKDLDTGEEQMVEIMATSGLTDYEIDKLVREKLIEDEQKRRREEKRWGEVVIDESDVLAKIKTQLKASIFSTQSKLNTEGKGFKGRARVLLEDALANARTMLESGSDQDELERITKELEQRALSLDEFIESQW